MKVTGDKLKVGDTFKAWNSHTVTISRLETYKGVLEADGCVAIAFGTNSTLAKIGMSIWSNETYELV